MSIQSATNVIQPHALMQARSQGSSHDVRPTKSGPSSAFSDYLFGPVSGGSLSSSNKASAPVAALKQANDQRA